MLQVKYIPDSMGEPVDICALLFGGYARFVPLDKIVLYGWCKPALWQFINVTVIFDIFSIV